MKVGFIGLGIMGKPMAMNLLKAKYELIVSNRSKSIDQLLSAGASSVDNIKKMGTSCDVIITMLPNSPEVKEVILGKEGIINNIKPGITLIDMSSIAPLASQEISKELEKKDVNFLDAPVSGGEPKAIEGTLSVMVGGKKDIFDKYYDLLKAMSGSVVYTGNVGAGNTTKLANQIIVALNIAAMSEALVLSTKAGVEPELVYNAIKGGLAGSNVLDAKAPSIMNREFDPGFKINLHIKDLQNAIDTAHEIGAPSQLTASVMEIMQAMKVQGEEYLDHSALIKYYERLAKVEVKNKC